MPAHHVLYNQVGQAVRVEQLEHLLPEQGLQVFGIGPVGHLELSLFVEAAVRGNNMKMGIEVLKVSEGLDRHHTAGHGVIIRDGMFQILAQNLPGGF